MKSPSKNSVRRAQTLLGTFVEITAKGLSIPELHKAISNAFEEIRRVHQELSFFDPASDVSRLNRDAFSGPIRVGKDCYFVLKAACKVSRSTDGLFDCSAGSGGSYRDIVFLSKSRIKFKRALTVDLGGIAKGFAVDRAVSVLKEKGVPSGCVNAGGDLRVFGEGVQPIHVRHPQNPSIFVLIGHFKDISFATSGIYFSKKIARPGTNRFYEDPSSISVMASECMMADALTKPVSLGPERSGRFLERFKAKAFILRPSS